MMPLKDGIARLFLSLVALSSAGWVVAILSAPNQSVQLNNTANRIMSGDGFQQKPLPATEQLLAAAEGRTVCNPLEMRGVAIIRVRLLEGAINASDTQLVEQRLIS